MLDPVRRRATRIAVHLIDGPRALFPPPHVDDFGWLEPQHYLLWRHPRLTIVEAIGVYCDNTINRDDHFLAPVLRHAVWQRTHDFRVRPVWPTVHVHLSYFESHRAMVHQQLLEFQHVLTHVPFAPHGLSTTRDVADIHTDYDQGTYRIMSHNGIQTLTFESPAIADNDAVTTQFMTLFTNLKAIMDPMERTGWRERYDFDITADMPHQAWDWDGEPKQL